jgi:hypothetical protein
MLLSLYFTNDEMHYAFFREQIYLAAKNNIIELKEFFIEDKNDPILANNKIEAYIEQIKENKFLAGVVEIYIAAKIFNIIIAVYEQLKFNSDFTPYSIFHPDSQADDYLLVNFENRNHYNLLSIRGKNKDKNIIENKYNDIDQKQVNLFK